MANKPFAIQGADLTLGGVNLQAGTTGIVVPGVTQAVNYRVEEVDDQDGNNPSTFGSNANAVTVIDNAEYVYRSGSANESADYVSADYSVVELDNGEIEEISVDGSGVFLDADKTRVEAANMWATITPNPFASFNANNWTQIPFRPKMRADEIENVGGGGNADLGNFTFNENTITNGDGLILNTNRGTLAIGTNMETPGVAGHFHIGFDGSNSQANANDLFLGDDYNYVKLPGYELNPVDHGVEIGTNDRDGGGDHVWRFGTDGNLTFPDGTIQTTAYTGQSSGSGALYIMANVDGDIVTSTDGVTWGTPIASGMSGINRVAVHNGVIVYIGGGEGPAPQPGLYYSTVIGTVELCTGTDTLEGDDIFWSQVRYFDEPNKWVAVGWVDGDPSHFPIVAHSVNGISWTKVPANDTFVTGFNTGDSTAGDWRLTDIAYMAETGDFVISSSLDNSGLFGGIFITDNVTVPLDETVHIAIDLDVDHTAPWSVVSLGGPSGYMILFGTNDEVWYGNGTVVEDYGSLEGAGPVSWSDLVADEIGYVPEISDIAYDATGFIAVTQDGQVITASASMGGPGFIVSVPLPYTVTDFSISRANPAVLTYTAPTIDSPQPTGLNNGEKIVITGSDQFDGTYYYKASDDTLYTDKELTSALDSSGFDPFVLGGTLTMSHGRYFDAAGTSPFYYYIGNDDEQIFRSSNGITWTQQADVTGEYFNDFAYGTFGTVTNESASLTDDKEVKITVGNADYWAIVNRANNADYGVESSAVAYDSEGNLIALHISDVVIGVDNDDNNIYQDRLIISKFDSSANLIWQKQIQEEMDNSQAHDVCIDDDDNIIVVFSQDNIDGADDTVSAIKYTSAGSELWKKDYHPAVVVTAVQEFDLDSATITSGTFNGTTVDVVTLSGDEDSLGFRSGWSLQESTDDGSTWTTIEPVLGFGAYDDNTDTTPLYLEANSGVTLSGGYYYRVTRQGANSNLELSSAVTNSTHTFIAARYNENDGPGTGYDQSCIIKIDNSDGSLVWAKSFYIDEEGFDAEPYGMEIDSGGNLVIVGGWQRPGPVFAFVSKFNGSTGAEIWTRILTTESYESTGGDVTADSQGNVFVSINAEVEIVHNQDDTYNKTAVYITKLNSLGVIQWTRRVGPGPCASIGTGIDCDTTGNVYLSAITTAQKNPNREDYNFNDYDITNTKDVLAIAKYSTSGAVLWQRYVEANGYNFYQSRDAADGVGNFDYSANSGRNLAISTTGKIAVQATVRKYDLDNDVHDTRYWESITFQIDQDGREMTIGSGDEKFVVKESRIPGKFVNLVDLEDSTTGGFAVEVRVSTLTTDIEVTTPTITYADAELAQQIIKSAPYEYVFGNDGTLTIPNDGDIKLTQTQIGWFSIFGQVDDNNFDVQNRANCVDPATGDVYVTGQETNNYRAFVARYNSVGELLWSIRLEDDDEGEGSRGNAIKMNPITGNVTLLAEYAGGENSMVLEIDPDTAQIVNQLGFKDSVSGDNAYAYTEAYDFDFQSDGSIVAVGRKRDERRTYSVTPLTGSTTDVLVINRSDIGSEAYTSAWRISGTGFVGYNGISFNRYSGLTGTVRQGSGATFNVTIAGDGSITTPVTVANGGTNYRVGHKIKIPYTAIGGADLNSDIILTVTAATNGVITGVAEGFYGGGAGTPNSYPAVSGTNYQTGSGLTFDFWGPREGTDYGNWDDHDITNGGTNYADGDVVVIPGTQLGGTSPANDLTAIVTVTTGTVDNFDDFRGTGQNTTVRIEAGGSTVDFGGAGTWALSYDTGGEAFVWTNRLEGWTKVVGSLNPNADERYFSVATGSDGSIYAAGEIYTDDSTNDYQAVISKFNSSGVHQWSRALNTNTDNDGASAKCVAVRGTTVVVSSYNSLESETVISKLDTSGNILWQRRTDSGDDSSVAIDTNGDIYAVTEAYFENKYNNLIKVIRFASNGEPIWRKFFSTLGLEIVASNNEYFKNGRNLTLDAEHFYVSGYTTAFDNGAERAFLVKLPKSGDCDGYYGSWTVQTDAYDVLKVNATQANTFTPNIRNGNFESWTPDILSNWWDPSNNDSYQTLQPVVDRDGGAIEFADGTRQTSSAQQISQLKISNVGQHRLCLDDMGKHIYVTNSNNSITVPAQYDNRLPIGFTVVIVNNSNGSIFIEGGFLQYGGGVNIIVPGVDAGSYWELANPGMATLIKVDEDTWFMTGNVAVSGP